MNDKEKTKSIISEMKEICDVWVKMRGPVKWYSQDEIHLIYEYITELQQESQQLKDELEWYKQQCDDLEMQIGCQE